MGSATEIQVVRVARRDLAKLEAFLRKDAAQAEPEDPDAPRAFVSGLRASLDAFEFLSADTHWLLAADRYARKIWHRKRS